MKHTEWKNKLKELSQTTDTKVLFESSLGITAIDICRLMLVFFDDTPLPADHQNQFDKCVSEIVSICRDIITEVVIKANFNFIYGDFIHYFSTNPPFSPALDGIFASMESPNPQFTPAIRKKVIELITLHLVLKHLTLYFYKESKPIYTLAFSDKSLEVLGTAKNLYGLAQDDILKFELLSDDDKTVIHKQIQREQGKQHALKATEPKRQERKILGEKYLRIMQEHGFTNWTKATEYIFMHENPENKSFDWITKTLKAVDKSEI